jgi:hypothetical protein
MYEIQRKRQSQFEGNFVSVPEKKISAQKKSGHKLVTRKSLSS